MYFEWHVLLKGSCEATHGWIGLLKRTNRFTIYIWGESWKLVTCWGVLKIATPQAKWKKLTLIYFLDIRRRSDEKTTIPRMNFVSRNINYRDIFCRLATHKDPISPTWFEKTIPRCWAYIHQKKKILDHEFARKKRKISTFSAQDPFRVLIEYDMFSSRVNIRERKITVEKRY